MKRILFILHLPPPVHGAALMGEAVAQSQALHDAFSCRYINLSASASLSEIGRFSLRKLQRVVRLYRCVIRELHEFNPEIVYLTPNATLPPLLKDWLIVLLARRKNRRIVLHFHNKGIARRKAHGLDPLVYRSLFRDSRVILLSEALYPDVQTYVPRDRVFICNNGIAAQLLPKQDNEPFTMVFLSNLLYDKGVVEVLDICHRLAAQGLPFRCLVAGAETKEMGAADFARLVSVRHLQERVSYLGPLYGPEKWALLSRASVFVYPTKNDAFPLVLIEAAAAGLPVVASREGGIPDIVQDGVTGVLCEGGNVEPFSAAVASLAKDPQLRSRMGTAARQRYQEKFTLSAFLSRMVSILEQV